MWVITEKRLKTFYQTHPNAKTPTLAWLRLMKQHGVHSFNELREVFPSADDVGGLTIFNIGGNNYRIIADVVYGKGRVYVKHTFTHAQYDAWNKKGQP